MHEVYVQINMVDSTHRSIYILRLYSNYSYKKRMSFNLLDITYYFSDTY